MCGGPGLPTSGRFVRRRWGRQPNVFARLRSISATSGDAGVGVSRLLAHVDSESADEDEDDTHRTPELDRPARDEGGGDLRGPARGGHRPIRAVRASHAIPVCEADHWLASAVPIWVPDRGLDVGYT